MKLKEKIRNIGKNKEKQELFWLRFLLLAFTIIPLFLFMLYFQYRLKHEQEEVLRMAYADQAVYIANTVNKDLSNVKDVMVTLNQNQVVKKILLNNIDSNNYLGQELRANVEKHVWYNITSSRSVISDIKIYGEMIDKPYGYFIYPFDWVDNQLAKYLGDTINYSGLYADKSNSALYYVYPIYSQFNKDTIGYIVALLDKSKMFSIHENDQNMNQQNFGYSFSFNSITLEKFIPDNIDTPLLEVNEKIPDYNLELKLYIPYNDLEVNVLPVVIFVLLAILVYMVLLLLVSKQMNILRKRIIDNQNELQELRFSSLQRQMDPHFLYNTLSMINWKAKYANQQDISDITIKLSKFYRKTLNNGKQFSTVKNEFEVIKIYLELKKEMMDEELTYEVKLDKRVENKSILNFIIQPLVENAIMHGISATGRSGHIELYGQARQNSNPGSLLVLLYDDGRGLSNLNEKISDNEQAFAIKNINRRITLMYGNNYGLIFYSQGNMYLLSDGLNVDSILKEDNVDKLIAQAKIRGTLVILYLP